LKAIILTILLAALSAGCALTPRNNSFEEALLASKQSQVQVRSYQSRIFETNDKISAIRAVIATMQDLGFAVTRTDANLGIVTGEKNHANSNVFMTVSIKEKNTATIIIRASISHNQKTIDYIAPYQDFFAALQKSIFLQINSIN